MPRAPTALVVFNSCTKEDEKSPEEDEAGKEAATESQHDPVVKKLGFKRGKDFAFVVNVDFDVPIGEIVRQVVR